MRVKLKPKRVKLKPQRVRLKSERVKLIELPLVAGCNVADRHNSMRGKLTRLGIEQSEVHWAGFARGQFESNKHLRRVK